MYYMPLRLNDATSHGDNMLISDLEIKRDLGNVDIDLGFSAMNRSTSPIMILFVYLSMLMRSKVMIFMIIIQA